MDFVGSALVDSNYAFYRQLYSSTVVWIAECLVVMCFICRMACAFSVASPRGIS